MTTVWVVSEFEAELWPEVRFGGARWEERRSGEPRRHGAAALPDVLRR